MFAILAAESEPVTSKGRIATALLGIAAIVALIGLFGGGGKKK